MRRAKIDLDPPYQRRGRLWSDTDKAYLIDSILNGYDIPKLYVADFTSGESPLNEKKLPYAIIDGKQRLEAIFDFFDGKLTLNDDFVYLADTSLRLGGLGYRDLQKNFPEISEEIDNYNLSVMSVTAQDIKSINELFVRLNRSKALTGAEIRNAMNGPAPELIRQIAKHDLFTTNISFPVKRGQDLNASAKLLVFEYENKITETKKSFLDSFVKRMEHHPSDKLELAGRKVLDFLTVTSEIFLPDDKLLSSSGVLPVYYWLIRNAIESDYHQIRKFLNEFERKRAENRRLNSSNPASINIDNELLNYDNYNRSTNDLQSHTERYRILLERFEVFKKKPNPKSTI